MKARKEIDIEKAISATLSDQEIVSAMQETGYAEDSLRTRLGASKAEILGGVSSEMGDLDSLKEKLNDAISKIQQRYERPLKRWVLSVTFGGVAIVVCYLFALLATLASHKLLPEFLSFLEEQSPFFTLTHALIVIIGSLPLLFFLLFAIYKYRDVRNARFSATESELQEGVGKALERATLSLSRALVQKGVKPVARQILNAELAPSYSTTLSDLHGTGLSEVFDPVYEVPTEAKELLLRRLRDMPGGSIGISGPRGAGKTTLIRTYCEDFSAEIAEQPVLSTMATAPVQYDARDFILHLFSLICFRTLRLEGVELAAADDNVLYNSSQAMNRVAKRMIRLATAFSTVLAHIFILLGAILLWNSMTTLSNTAAEQKADLGTTSTGADNSWLSTVSEVAKALGLSAGQALLWGLVFGFIAVGLLVYYSQEFKQRSSQLDQKTDSDLARLALRWLQAIKFQQSFTSGWSGSMKLPIGVGGTLSAGMKIARNPLSLPEIIEAYRQFIDEVRDRYRVIIGIDELDKIATTDTAQRFLNEIKSLFGIEHCFYLISISENAMSNFERRGLPFRDAFDSAFDDVITVDYLTLDDAKRLLHRRVIGLPVPFLDLCYCMSGGLARDLIRACRKLVELREHYNESAELSNLASSLIRQDVGAKERAIRLVAKDIPLEPTATEFLEKLHKLERDISKVLDSRALKEILESDASHFAEFSTKAESAAKDLADEAGAQAQQLRQLALELSSYLLYAVTMLEVFTLETEEVYFRKMEEEGLLADLARSRQVFAVNPGLSRSIVEDVRSELNTGAAKGKSTQTESKGRRS